MGMKKYWYKFTYTGCPICGQGKTYKERMYTKKPRQLGLRYSWDETYYDYCNE